MIIYKATNKVNGKIYIGQTSKTLEQRKNGHERDTRSRKKHTTYFHEALAKYGYDNFDWEVIANANTQEELDEMEKHYIQVYNATDKEFGYNLKKGGKEGGLYNEECRRRLGESTKKKWGNPETAKKMMDGLKKGTETVKERAKNFWDIRICANCGKTFKVKPHIKNKYCSYKCACVGERNNIIQNLKLADEINSENFEKERKERCIKLFEWLRDNIDIVINAKFNKLTFIKDIDEYIGVTDDRTTAKVVGCSYRRDFIYFLQKCIQHINKRGDSKCDNCGCETVENNGYIICPSCGYSKCS